MKTVANFLLSLIMAAWIGSTAVFSIQNFAPVSLKFLAFESIKFPVGVLLSFCLGGGMILGAIAPLFLGQSRQSKRRRSPQDEDLEEFGFD